jgi:hypothetical protein
MHTANIERIENFGDFYKNPNSLKTPKWLKNAKKALLKYFVILDLLK